MQSTEAVQKYSVPRKRRQYSPAFKAQLVASCAIAGTSVAAVAKVHDIDQGVLRRWISESKQAQLNQSENRQQLGFVPVVMGVEKPMDRLELSFRRGELQATLSLPVDQHSQCAAMLKLILS